MLTTLILLALQYLPLTTAAFGPAIRINPVHVRVRKTFVENNEPSHFAPAALKPTKAARQPGKGPHSGGVLQWINSQEQDPGQGAITSTTPLAKRAAQTSSASISTCTVSDDACNYCAIAFDLLDTCYNLVYNADLDITYVPDCLCYEAVSDTNTSAIWAPNYFDKAFASCPVYASTADPSDVSDLQSATNLCSSFGDYYAVRVTDQGNFTIEATTSSGFTGMTTPSPTSTRAAGTATATSAPQSSGHRLCVEYTGPFQILYLSVLAAMLF